MARRRRDEGFFDDLYEMLVVVPAWVGPPLALLFFLVLRFLIPAIFGSSEKPNNSTVVAGVAKRVALPVAGLVLFIWLLAEFQKWRRRRLLDAQSGLNSIRDLSWQEFEHLVGEAYRRQGYVVQETGSASGDGGIDILYAGKTISVRDSASLVLSPWKTKRPILRNDIREDDSSWLARLIWRRGSAILEDRGIEPTQIAESKRLARETRRQLNTRIEQLIEKESEDWPKPSMGDSLFDYLKAPRGQSQRERISRYGSRELRELVWQRSLQSSRATRIEIRRHPGVGVADPADDWQAQTPEIVDALSSAANDFERCMGTFFRLSTLDDAISAEQAHEIFRLGRYTTLLEWHEIESRLN